MLGLRFHASAFGCCAAPRARERSSGSTGEEYDFYDEDLPLRRASRRRTTHVDAAVRKTLTRFYSLFINVEAEQFDSGNENRPADYIWLAGVLEALAGNTSTDLGATVAATGVPVQPLFMVIGSCPSIMADMQAMLFATVGSGTNGDGANGCPQVLDFWWAKPNPQGDGVEATLSLHASGPHKNEPSQSRKVYQPLADLFNKNELKGGWRFGIQQPPSASTAPVSSKDSLHSAMSVSTPSTAAPQGETPCASCPYDFGCAYVAAAPRAFMRREDGAGAGGSDPLYVILFWQEDWTANPFAWSRYIKGKVVYQKDPHAEEFYARSYSIVDGSLVMYDDEGPAFANVLPDNSIKQLPLGE